MISLLCHFNYHHIQSNHLKSAQIIEDNRKPLICKINNIHNLHMGKSDKKRDHEYEDPEEKERRKAAKKAEKVSGYQFFKL